LNIVFDNVNFNSNSGPNSFANKLKKYLTIAGHSVNKTGSPEAFLCFIESSRVNYDRPMFQRLDGIYFNSDFDYNKQNQNIKRTYELADGVIFQSEFNMNLTNKFFGKHRNSTIIHNGADTMAIKSIKPLPLDKYEKLYVCASSWRPHKRLGENIRYFLEHSGVNDGLIIAGNVPQPEKINDSKIHYVGNRNQSELLSLYKRADFFIHLAWIDHCPNVVVDARACGCKIICSSTGGTKEIAGMDAIIIKEKAWDLKPVKLYDPPLLDFSKKEKNNFNTEVSMKKVAEKYINFIKNN